MTPMEEEEPEKLVNSFYNYLKQEKGLSKETASAHAHQISFFANNYLIGYEEKKPTGSYRQGYRRLSR